MLRNKSTTKIYDNEMVSVVGKELVPYDASLVQDISSPCPSPSIVIDSSTPTEDEDSPANDERSIELRSSREISCSDSDGSLPDAMVDRNSLSLLVAACEASDELDASSVKEILEDHIRYPPQHNLGDIEDVPATRERLNYFLKVLNLKVTKYNKLTSVKIPQTLKSIPLALSYETFITLYWPGAMSCCQRLYKSSQAYSGHYYKKHKPPSPPFLLSCVSPNTTSPGKNHTQIRETPRKSPSRQLAIADVESDVSSDIISLPDESNSKSHQQEENSKVASQPKVYRQQILQFKPEDRTPSVSKKRKALSPSSRPGPLSHKMARLNQAVSTVDSSVDSGDEKVHVKPKRQVRKRRSTNDEQDEQDKYDQLMDQLNADQMKFEPQHEPGAPENFIATPARISYFHKVIGVKLEKYNSLNSNRPTSPLRHIPLALSFSGFMQYYWPGKAICCGIIRENSHVLEKHIGRCHRPPKGPPVLSPLPEMLETSPSNSTARKNLKTEPTGKSISKCPAGFLEDQHKFPPQHKPGEPEDFLANQESIAYFLEVLKIKREKYPSISPVKEKPLSSPYSDFVSHYWPGIVSCCEQVFMSCKDFATHLTNSHLPPKKFPKLMVVSQSELSRASEAVASVPVTGTVPRVSPRSFRLSPHSLRSGQQTGEQSSSRSISPRVVTSIPTSSNQLKINSIHDEARQLRTQAASISTLSTLMPLLERLLELSASIAVKIRGVDVEARPRAVECLEYVWNATKTAIIRWEDLKNRATRDKFLCAIQYAYGTLPVFINWDKPTHLEMLENAIELCLNTVKNWHPTPSSPESSKAELKPSSSRLSANVGRRFSKKFKTDVVTTSSEETPSSSPVPPAAAAAAGPDLSDNEKNTSAVVEFCRIANIAIGQNTKSRGATGFKDNNGHHHAMYRYGIGAMLKLYCPPGITHLKCCDLEFDLDGLREHVTQNHDASLPDRSEPSISPI